MIQDILTYLTILAAGALAVHRIGRAILQALRGESPGCSGCSGSCALRQRP